MYGANFRFKIDWASLVFGKKFAVILCFTLYYKTISKYKPPAGEGGRLYLEGRLNGRFLALRAWGAYIWRGLFSEFYTVYFLSKKTPIKADNFVLLRFLFEDGTY